MGKHALRSGICSSFMRSPMTPHFSDAPAVPSKSQGEEGICHGGADNDKFSALKMTGDTSITVDCEICPHGNCALVGKVFMPTCANHVD